MDFRNSDDCQATTCALGLALTFTLTPALTLAAQRTLVDSDHDGLIEINDLAGRNTGSGHGVLLPNQHFELSHIQCASDSNLCDGLQYSDWQNAVNSSNEALWQFGGQNEVPALNLPMATLQDADGDGEADSWPAFTGEELPDPDPVDPDPIDPDPVDPEPEQPRKGSGGGAMLWWLALGVTLLRRRV